MVRSGWYYKDITHFGEGKVYKIFTIIMCSQTRILLMYLRTTLYRESSHTLNHSRTLIRNIDKNGTISTNHIFIRTRADPRDLGALGEIWKWCPVFLCLIFLQVYLLKILYNLYMQQKNKNASHLSLDF